MEIISTIKEGLDRVKAYLISGGVFFPAWFLWNIKETEFLYVGGYFMHFIGGVGATLLATVMVIGGGNVSKVSKRFYWYVFPGVFTWLTAMEWTQAVEPWRTFEWLDIFTQTLGLILVLSIVWFKESRTAALPAPVPAE